MHARGPALVDARDPDPGTHLMPSGQRDEPGGYTDGPAPAGPGGGAGLSALSVESPCAARGRRLLRKRSMTPAAASMARASISAELVNATMAALTEARISGSLCRSMGCILNNARSCKARRRRHMHLWLRSLGPLGRLERRGVREPLKPRNGKTPDMSSPPTIRSRRAATSARTSGDPYCIPKRRDRTRQSLTEYARLG